MTITCDHPECEKESVGYISRQLQGPFYCIEHYEWALALVNRHWQEIEEAFLELQDDTK